MNQTIASYLFKFEFFQMLLSSFEKFLGQYGHELLTGFILLLGTGVVVVFALTIGGLGTYFERKISADIQMRHGPNRVGPYGILQFVADGVKMLGKEDIIPYSADKFLYMIAPLLCLVGVMGTLAVFPFSEGFILTDLNVGIFYLLGISSLIGIGIFIGGYSSNSKWSMLGGMRGASQIISYEIPVTICILCIVVLSGGLSLKTLVEAQGALPHQWYLLHNPFTFLAFIVFFVSMLAEANRAPFDLPEAESELVSGYHTEFSGMRFAFFALAEYIEIFVLSGIAAALFLGGYNLPFIQGNEEVLSMKLGFEKETISKIVNVIQVLVFLTKTFVLYYIIIWVRWTLPRIRVDHVMSICWKYLMPISLFNLIGCAAWVSFLNSKPIWSLIFGSG